MKSCFKCKRPQEKAGKCPECRSAYEKERWAKNKNIMSISSKNRYVANIEERRENNKKWHRENREKVLARKKLYRIDNKEHVNAKSRAWHWANKEYAKAYASINHRIREYGLSPEGFESLMVGQNNVCPICQHPFNDENPAVVDHDHNTGEIRGLLHSSCNRHVGLFERHPDRKWSNYAAFEGYLHKLGGTT